METAIAFQEKQTLPNAPRLVSLDEYFRLEEKSLHKNEYHAGKIIPLMAGALLPHNQLASRANAILDNFVFDNDLDFVVNNSDLKIRIENYDKVVYSDAVVICDEPVYFKSRKDTIINPTAIVEVLSKSTKNFDETTKFEMYRTLPSFKQYVLIHQNRILVTVHTKKEDGTWLLKDYDSIEQIAVLSHIQNCEMPLKRLYHKLKK